MVTAEEVYRKGINKGLSMKRASSLSETLPHIGSIPVLNGFPLSTFLQFFFPSWLATKQEKDSSALALLTNQPTLSVGVAAAC